MKVDLAHNCNSRKKKEQTIKVKQRQVYKITVDEQWTI